MSFIKKSIFGTFRDPCYASCYFDTGVYQSLGGSYLPGDQNSNEDGSARDVLGREVKYRCMEAGCTMKRQVP